MGNVVPVLFLDDVFSSRGRYKGYVAEGECLVEWR